MGEHLSLEFIKEFADSAVKWRMSCVYQRHMNEDFLNENIKNICMTYTLKYQNITERWIRKNRKNIRSGDWETVKNFKKFSSTFIKEMDKYYYGRGDAK